MINDNNLKPKKISKWKRLFWSWDKLVNYFENFYKIDEFRQQENNKNLIDILKPSLNGLIIEQIEKLQKTVNDFNELQKKNQELNEENKKLKKIEISSARKDGIIVSKEKVIEDLNKKIKELNITNSEYHDWKTQINEKIASNYSVMQKMENTFFRSIKQHGILGEKGIEQIFEQCNMEEGKLWIKNLTTINGKTVEYAFRMYEDEEKWIPIDVKTFQSYKPNEKGEINFDDLIGSIELESKKIKNKYVNTKNTHPIGIMVIPDDKLCLEISRRYIKKIKQIFDENKIVIASTSTFLQWCYILWFSFTLSKEFYESQKFHEDVKELMELIQKFIEDIIDIRKEFGKLKDKFHSVEDIHYEKTKKQYEKLKDELKLSDKHKLKPDVVKKYKIS